MPKQRTGTTQFGCYLELVAPEATKFVNQCDGNFLVPRSALARMARFAAAPEIWLQPATEIHNDAKLAFARFYCESPDFTLALMTEFRRLFSRKDKRFLIQRYLSETIVTADGTANTWNLKADAVAFEVQRRFGIKGISGDDVRNAEKELRKRLSAPRPEYFRTAHAPELPQPVFRNAKRSHKIR
jgi:hypothetical protein